MPDTLTKAETALMGLLLEGPAHPYQLEKNVTYRCMRDWSELSMSSIYKLLRKFEKKGWVTCKTEISPESKTRKIYTASPAGRQAMKNKVKALLSEPEKLKWQMDIATYNLDCLTPKEIRAALEKYQALLTKQAADYQALDAFLAKEGCPWHRREVAKRPLHLIAGEQQWVDGLLKKVKSLPQGGKS